jgi:hypothetical protein
MNGDGPRGLNKSDYQAVRQSEPYKIIRMSQVTIASVRAHGVRTLLVYCNGKREDDCRRLFW